MSRKRKRLKKLLMAIFPRDGAEFYINLGLICDLDYAAQIRAVKDVLKKREDCAGDSGRGRLRRQRRHDMKEETMEEKRRE